MYANLEDKDEFKASRPGWTYRPCFLSVNDRVMILHANGVHGIHCRVTEKDAESDTVRVVNNHFGVDKWVHRNECRTETED